MENVKTEIIELTKLALFPGNAKIHTEEQVTHLMQSLELYGWTQPIVIDEDNFVLVGEGRLTAARKLDWKDAPCIRKTGLTKEEKIALNLADNKLQHETVMDVKKVAENLQELKFEGISLEQFGLTLPEFKPEEHEVKNQVDEQQSSIKQMVVIFEKDHYEEVVKRLEQILKKKPELENHTLIFIEMLEKFLGE